MMASRSADVKPLRWVEVDLSAVAHNVRTVRGLLEPSVRFTAVVKADAYGHGVVPVSRTALKSGADALAVTYLEEALEIRRAGLKAPLLVMGPVLPEQAPLAAKHGLAVMADNGPLLKALHRAGSRGRPIPVHVKVDLGLSRWGLALEQVPAFLKSVSASSGVRLTGVFCHPGYMIEKNGPRVEEALQQFLSVARGALPGGPPVELHAADSAVLLDFPLYRLSRVRVGNLIYGINPTKKPLPLKNPWRALSRLVHVQKLSVGQTVGYGGEFTATTSMTVATVPAGYAHGLTLEPASRWIQVSAGQGYWGMIGDVRCPFVGRVGMSHCLLDVSAVGNPQPGDIVQLPLRRTVSSNWTKIYRS